MGEGGRRFESCHLDSRLKSLFYRGFFVLYIKCVKLLKIIYLIIFSSIFCQIDHTLAEQYFEEAFMLCEKDGGKLWGISLYGPMYFGDATNDKFVTNQNIIPNTPKPKYLGYTNAAFSWGDSLWSSYVWKLIPNDEKTRKRLLIHELFHRIQPDLDLLGNVSLNDNSHLDELHGRYWLQLERRALIKSLQSKGKKQIDAIKDALTFRQYRHSLFTNAAQEEQMNEINEGLAQYTATTIVNNSFDSACLDAIEQLKSHSQEESFIKTFPYSSGAAYGMLLEKFSIQWTHSITITDDLGILLLEALDIQKLPNPKIAAKRYDGDNLLLVEIERNSKKSIILDSLKQIYVDGPKLTLSYANSATFDAVGAISIPDIGTVYYNYNATDKWGSLISASALILTKGRKIILPLDSSITGSQFSGSGWEVKLNSGYKLVKGEKEGDYFVPREKNHQ